MKFRGSFNYSVDAKLRIMLPNELRAAMKEMNTGSLIILPGFSDKYKYLFLLPKAYCDKIETKLENLKFFDGTAQKIFTFFFGNSFEIEPDNQGRIRIPPLLHKMMGFNNDVVITGEGDFMKLWEPADHAAMLKEELAPASGRLEDLLKEINEKYGI